MYIMRAVMMEDVATPREWLETPTSTVNAHMLLSSHPILAIYNSPVVCGGLVCGCV